MHAIALRRLSVGFDKLLVSVKGTFHKENSTKDFGATQHIKAMPHTPQQKRCLLLKFPLFNSILLLVIISALKDCSSKVRSNIAYNISLILLWTFNPSFPFNFKPIQIDFRHINTSIRTIFYNPK